MVPCRSFLEAHGVEQLLVVAVARNAGHGGVNRAARSFHQIPLDRSLFDDTKVACFYRSCSSLLVTAQVEITSTSG